MHDAWIVYFVTEFGDQGVVLPFVLTVAIALVVAGAHREALLWSIAIVFALGGVLAAKLVFLPCGHLLPNLHLRSPSGHAAAALAAYGGFAVLWAKLARDYWLRVSFVTAGIIVGLAIAMSRVLIGVHTTPEVLLGGLIGLSAPAILTRAVERPENEPAPRPTLLLLLVPLLFALLLHGVTLPVEGRIEHFAMWFMGLLGVCV